LIYQRGHASQLLGRHSTGAILAKRTNLRNRNEINELPRRSGPWGRTDDQLAEQRCAKKLARSVGASPTQARPSRPPGSECCVSRRRRRPRSVHSCCMGCVIEPRNRLLAGAEIIFVIERNTSNAAMRGAARPAGVEEHITCKRIAYGTWEVPRLAIGSDAVVRIGKARSRSR
jgi:hypothetical protein